MTAGRSAPQWRVLFALYPLIIYNRPMKGPWVFLLLYLFVGSLGAQDYTIEAAADYWPPYTDPAAAEGGIAVEIVRRAFQEVGYILAVDHLPWLRAKVMAKSHQYDIILDFWRTEERAEEFLFSHPYLTNRIVFIKRRDDPFQYRNWEDLADKRIGVIRGYGYSDAFLNAPDIHRISNVSFHQNILMLLHHRLDLVIEARAAAEAMLRAADPALLHRIEFCEPPLIVKALHIGVSRNHPAAERIIELFNRGLKSLRNSGRYDAILAKYGLLP